MRRMILTMALVLCAVVLSLEQASGTPATMPTTAPAANESSIMPDDATSKAYADTVAKAQERMRETLKPKLELRAEAYKKANDAFLPAAKSAYEALQEVCRKAAADTLAAYDARIRDITKTGDLDGALAARTAKEKFRAWLPSQENQLLVDFQALTNVDPEKAGLAGRADDSFRIKSIEMVPFDASNEQLRLKMEAAFPIKNNQARGGMAKASSTNHETQDPLVTLGGNRKTDSWTLAAADTKRWYWASWDDGKPAIGKYILIFGRPAGPACECYWGDARIQVNGLPPMQVQNMGPQRLVVIELDKVAAITSVKIEFGNGAVYGGLAGLEIHREIKGRCPR